MQHHSYVRDDGEDTRRSSSGRLLVISDGQGLCVIVMMVMATMMMQHGTISIPCPVLPSLLAPSLQAALHRLLNPSPSGHIRKLQQDSNDNNNAEECYQIRLDINLHRNNKFIIESQSVISLLLSDKKRRAEPPPPPASLYT